MKGFYMSLTKQLWIAILLIMLVTLAGTFVISTFSARYCLAEQLYLKNLDNANSLALSISQMEKDPATLELLVSAQFDSGHYQFIRLVAPSGAVLVERSNPPMQLAVPEWFPRLVTLEVEAGTATVQDGWQRFGTLTVQSHSRFAYDSLWQQMQRLFWWFLCGIFISGGLGTFLLRWITRPLDRVVEQAEAIGGGKFVRIQAPRTLELRSVANAMNRLSDRVKAMLEKEGGRLEKFRHAAHYDAVTGLLNRQQFINQVESVLAYDDASAAGALIIARVGDLDHLNRKLGRKAADEILKQMAEQLTTYAETRNAWVVGRLNGSDFSLLAGGADDAQAIAENVAKRLYSVVESLEVDGERLLPVGGTLFEPGEAPSEVLARVDNALLSAEHTGASAVQISRPELLQLSLKDHPSWRAALSFALQKNHVRLGQYPVTDSRQKLLHFESPVRVLIDGAWRHAALIIPWAARLNLLPQFDALAVQVALQNIAEKGAPLSVNVSPEALCDAGYRKEICRLLRQSPEAASKLWLETPEYGAYRHLGEFRSFCNALKPLGCRIGLEHVGHQFYRISELHDLGLDYIKVDASLVREVHSNPTGQTFLRGLCTLAHTIGLTVLAEGVQSREELDCLPDLGLDGMTGPAVKLAP